MVKAITAVGALDFSKRAPLHRNRMEFSVTGSRLSASLLLSSCALTECFKFKSCLLLKPLQNRDFIHPVRGKFEFLHVRAAAINQGSSFDRARSSSTYATEACIKFSISGTKRKWRKWSTGKVYYY